MRLMALCCISRVQGQTQIIQTFRTGISGAEIKVKFSFRIKGPSCLVLGNS